MNKSEFELIGRIAGQFRTPDGVTGIGDDCAIIPQSSGKDTLVTTDMLVEGSHFLLEDISARELGWKSAAVNLSDIAAMGGKPTGAFLSLALPKSISDEWMDDFVAGFKDICERCDTPLLGGDTTASPDRLCINVGVIGECPAGTARTRAAACVGDLVCVTGTLGDSAAGLRLILHRACAPDRESDQKYLIRRHYLPTPRVSEGMKLAGCSGVHAMMDISDGIASDLRHILKASGVGAEIDLQALPLSTELLRVCDKEGWDATALAVEGGEDYELLFTMAPGTEPPVPCTVIGRIVSGVKSPGTDGEAPASGPAQGDIHWIGGQKIDYQGFKHF